MLFNISYINIINKIRKLIESDDTGLGRLFDLIIQSLIVLSLITFSIGTLPDISERLHFVLFVFEIVTVIIFSIEYIFRIIITKNKLTYIFSFYGIIDLIAILPFYVSSGIDLRTVRVFRLLRLFRIFKLFRYNQAIARFHKALITVKEELVLFSFITILLIYLSGVGIYYFENDVQPEAFKSVFHGFWWAIATLTTVGYGDIYPVTAGGKLFTFFILFIGLGIVAVPTGLLAAALSQARKEENLNLLDKCKDYST